MDRPPASRESGEHVLSPGSDAGEPPRPPRRRRESGDRISFDSIARLVQPSMPPRSYDTLTPVAKSDLRPPAMPAATAGRARPGRRGWSAGVKAVSAIAAVALGAGLSAALHASPTPSGEQVVAGAAISPAAPAEEPTTGARADEVAPQDVVQLDEQVLPAEPEPPAEPEERGALEAETTRDDDAERSRRDDDDTRHARERSRDDDVRASERPTEATASRDERAEPAPAEPAPRAPAEAEPVEAAAAELPAHPSREDVQSAMLGALPAIRECAAGQNGTVQVEITVGSSGRVRNAVVTGAFAGTPEGSCMAREMRGVRLPRFTQESFTVRYPFRI